VDGDLAWFFAPGQASLASFTSFLFDSLYEREWIRWK